MRIRRPRGLSNGTRADNQNVSVSLAEARALGLYSASGGLSDGTIDFSSNFAFDFDPGSGEIGGRRPFVQLDPEAGGFPDGLTVDREGFVWSAQPVYGRIARYDPDGGIDRIVDLPVSRGTGVAFGGPDLEVLYITSATETLTDAEIAEEPLAGSVFACTPGVRGIAETPFAG